MCPDAHLNDTQSGRPAVAHQNRLNLLAVNEAPRLNSGFGALLSNNANPSEQELDRQHKANQSVLGSLFVKAADKLNLAPVNPADRRLFEEDVEHYGPGFLKTAGLFLGGKYGWMLTAGSFALDEVKVQGTPGEMAVDAVLGLGKGAATKGLLQWSMARDWSPAKMGVVTGGLSRVIDNGLSRRTYLDADNKFDLTGGLERTMTRAGNPGAVMADIAIFGTAHLGTHAVDRLTKGAVMNSPFWRTAVTGGSFGMSSGFSSEFLRQYSEGKYDAERLLKRTFIQGALDATASMGGGFQAARAERAKLAQENQTKQQSLVVSEAQLKSGKLVEPTSDPILERALKLVPENLSELTARLGKPETRSESFAELKGENPTGHEDFHTWSRENLTWVEKEVNVYKHGNTEIIVPKNHDANLGRLRTALADKSSPEASRVLAELGKHLLPEELLPAIESLPDPSLAQRVYLLPEKPATDHFRRQFDPGHTSAAEATPDGSLYLYGPRRGDGLNIDVRHEWAHLLKWAMPRQSHMFDLAAELEQDGHFARDYARPKAGAEPIENWAIHTAEELMADAPDRARHFGFKAPVRTAVILDALQTSLAKTEPAMRSQAQTDLANRIQSLQAEIMPRALEQLTQTARSGDAAAAESAAKLLLQLNAPIDPATLTGVRSMTINSDSFLNDAMISQAAKMPLTRLDISSVELGQNALNDVVKSPTLLNLSLRNVGLSDFAAGSLRPSKTLVTLDLSGNARLTSIPAAVTRLPNLRQVDVSGTAIPVTQIEALRQSRPQLAIMH